MPGAWQSERREERIEEGRRQIAAIVRTVCEAARQEALDAATAALAAAANPEAANQVRGIANQILSRVTLVQRELDRFAALARSQQR